ncbi:hypothetical protein [Kitasatospora viridis]|uniref:Uncharacterized protein n=1 Tax=Kitasatospora viridis TaxID=281105 RepID=A0A561UQ06_9ACTN|nr:hypothetical protein [Kitasatospora viridis]TWG01414.1 hypothetical protein FHX73_115307 [Kitasatospora viridis]
MGRQDSGDYGALSYTAIGTLAVGLGGAGLWYLGRETLLQAGLTGTRGTLAVQRCVRHQEPRTVDNVCTGPVSTAQQRWTTDLHGLPAAYPVGRTIGVVCDGHDCRQPDTSAAAGCVMGLCVLLLVFAAGLRGLLLGARAVFGADFLRVAEPRRAKRVANGFLAFWLAVIAVFALATVTLFAAMP